MTRSKTQAQQFDALLKKIKMITEGENTAHDLHFEFKDGSTTHAQFDFSYPFTDAFGENDGEETR